MSERLLEIEVLRYDPEQDSEPHFQSYEVPCQNDWAILDGLNYIKENLDTTLAIALTPSAPPTPRAFSKSQLPALTITGRIFQ